MYYSLANLRASVRKNNLMDFEYTLHKHHIEVPGFKVEESGKKGVFKLTSEGNITNRNVLHIVYNPELYENGEVSASNIIQPGTNKLVVGFRPFNNDFKLESLEYFANIYIDDTLLGRVK